MLKPATAKSFSEYAHEVFMLYMPMSKFQQTTQLDLVWDGYLPDYLKGSTRAKRGKGVRRRVLGRASLPSNWVSFLRVDDNKTELFCFLSGALLDSFQLAEKELVITNRDTVLSKPPLQDTTSLAPRKKRTLAIARSPSALSTPMLSS